MNRVLQPQDEFNVVFIHSAMDDAGLSPYAFRIYCHLSRRANRDNKAWPGKASMARACCLSESSVQRALKELQVRHMVKIKACEGGRDTNVYILTPPSLWTGFPQEGVLQDPPGGSTGHPKVLHEGNPSSPSNEDKALKEKKESPKADPRHQEVVTIWHDLYKQRFGTAYAKDKKDYAMLSTFLKNNPSIKPADMENAVDQIWTREVKAKFTGDWMKIRTLNALVYRWNDIVAAINSPS